MSLPNRLPNGWCYYILEGQRDENGYIPSIVIEDDPDHYPMMGNGPGARPYYWGQTYEEAKATAERVNAEMGITPQRADEIVMSSMRASNLRKARKGTTD